MPTIVDEVEDSDGEALVDEIIDAYGNLKDTTTTPFYGAFSVSTTVKCLLGYHSENYVLWGSLSGFNQSFSHAYLNNTAVIASFRDGSIAHPILLDLTFALTTPKSGVLCYLVAFL